VQRLFEELESDLVDTLMLSGCSSVSRVPADLVVR
jgi:hypothetical protein